MQRRHFVKAGLAGAALTAAGPTAAAAAVADSRMIYELRTYELRNDLGPTRASDFFEQHLVPALRRAGAGTVGAFTPDIGMATPSLVLLVAYPSMADVAAVAARVDADAALRAARDAWERAGGPPYVRYDVALYEAFPGQPRLEAPPAAAGAQGRLFELRTYEAPSEAGLRAKVAMFDQEEVRIFRASGFAPVFFGTAVAGPRLPHLTYMLAFDDLAARNAAWGRFGSNPDWQRVRVRPGWTDPETVSSIRAAYLRPTRYSALR